ncbi:MAG: hypothetical protein AAF692_02545 [Pseudomonadota bacterium]
MRFTYLVTMLAAIGMATPAYSQALPDSAWDEALETRKACEGEIALERDRNLVLGTGKVLCEDRAKRWEKSITAQFGADMAQRYAHLIRADALATAGYQYQQRDYRRKVSEEYVQKEKDFGCSLLRKALPEMENRLTGVPYSEKGHAFTLTTIRRITYEFQFCGANAKGLVKGMGSTKFHKAAGQAQMECAKNTEATANARISMCKAGMGRIRTLLRDQPYPTVLQQNSAYLWQAHAFITMLEVKSQNGREAEACKERRGFEDFVTWLALPADSAQRFLLKNIAKRNAALQESCA